MKKVEGVIEISGRVLGLTCERKRWGEVFSEVLEIKLTRVLMYPSSQSAFTYIVSFGSQRILLGKTGNILILGDIEVKGFA